jgi:hypothetical protein
MKVFSEQLAVHEAVSLLGQWVPGASATADTEVRGHVAVDAMVQVGEHRFLIETKARPTADALASAASRLKSLHSNEGIPLIVVPFMSELGRARCREAQISWLDLSGNADICAPGLRILIDGRPNRFKRPGRVSTAFAARGARVTRFLLQHPRGAHHQAEVAKETGSNPGHVSKVVSKLLLEQLVQRDEEGRIRVPEPDRLLDAWLAEYDFAQHEIAKCSIATRSGQETTAVLAERLSQHGVAHAATGLSAAYLIDAWATFRIATLFVDAPLTPKLLEALSVQQVGPGGNLWLVAPNDSGVFDGSSEREGVVCAHPVQVYLDLQGHPERSKEAAEHLRQHWLDWGSDGGQADHS